MRRFRLLFAALVCVSVVTPAGARGDVRGTLFEAPDFAAGQPFTNADGWKQASFVDDPGGQPADHGIVANTNPDLRDVFGAQSLRISNASTSGVFGTMTFSAPVVDGAGEKESKTYGNTGGVRRSRFVASFRFASFGLNPAEQPGLALSVSPDDGEGARMGIVRLTDTPDGLKVTWTDAVKSDNAAGYEFAVHDVADGLSRTASHLVVVSIKFVDGDDNDVAQVAVDGGKPITATTWETFNRLGEHRAPTRADSLMFRTAGAKADPSVRGKGFEIDDMRVATPLFYGGSNNIPPPPPGGGPSGGGGGGGTSPAADGSTDPAPLVVRSARLDRARGTVRLNMFCPTQAGLCAGTVTIRADRQNVASKGFNQNGGAKFPLTLHLSSDARRRISNASKVQGLVLSRDEVGIATRLTRTLRS